MWYTFRVYILELFSLIFIDRMTPLVKSEISRSNLKKFYSRSSFFMSNNNTNPDKLDLSSNSQLAEIADAGREINLFTSRNMSNYVEKET